MIALDIKKPRKEYRISMNVPIYGGKLMVVFTDSILGSLMNYSKKPNSPISIEGFPGEPLGFTFEVDGSDIGIFVDTKAQTATTLAHEIIHACSIVLEKVGVAFTPESEEAYTYLHSALMQACMGYMKKNKIKPW